MVKGNQSNESRYLNLLENIRLFKEKSVEIEPTHQMEGIFKYLHRKNMCWVKGSTPFVRLGELHSYATIFI